MKYLAPVATAVAATALVTLSACGGSSESKDSAGSSSSSSLTAKTPRGEKPIVGLAGEMCHQAADQFPITWEGKKSSTGERIFLVPKDATAVTPESVLEGSSTTLPVK